MVAAAERAASPPLSLGISSLLVEGAAFLPLRPAFLPALHVTRTLPRRGAASAGEDDERNETRPVGDNRRAEEWTLCTFRAASCICDKAADMMSDAREGFPLFLADAGANAAGRFWSSCRVRSRL